jgi:hypothetical protein
MSEAPDNAPNTTATILVFHINERSPESLRMKARDVATADHLTLYRASGFLTADLEPRFSLQPVRVCRR